MKRNKSNYDEDKLRMFFTLYMLTLYTLDLISTYLAVKGGGYETNPIIRHFIQQGLAGYLTTFIFFISLVFMFIIVLEIICSSLIKFYGRQFREIVYLASYVSILSMFSVIQITNIIGNLFIWIS